ncbi:MAG: hypothetical protein PHY02_02725 [Phycisphaerae bacterium]|nr:hypothetical protein [Phycisphaerae bacterium]
MNKRQKAILRDTATVIAITAIAVVAMIALRNWINRSEAMRAMEHLGRVVVQYRQSHGSVPSESYINRTREELEGRVRLGDVTYRAQWINFESSPDEILAYTEKPHGSWLFGKRYIVLRLDGRIEWMGKQKLDMLLAQQRSFQELESLREKSKQILHPPSFDPTFSP